MAKILGIMSMNSLTCGGSEPISVLVSPLVLMTGVSSAAACEGFDSTGLGAKPFGGWFTGASRGMVEFTSVVFSVVITPGTMVLLSEKMMPEVVGIAGSACG